MDKLSYKDSGVDIEQGNRLVGRIRELAESTHHKHVMQAIGGFASAVSVPSELEQPVMVSSSDGVGTKLKLAFLTGKHDTVGIDLVAMNVNDLLCTGGKPLFFLDYMSFGKLDSQIAASVIEGIAEGCRQAGCALVGGETAEMPGFYPPGEYDLAGFCVGIADRAQLIDGSRVCPGDAVIGLPSSGFHSNGYSLVRKVFDVENADLSQPAAGMDMPLGEALLEPTRIYVRDLEALSKSCDVRALAHITGGGLIDNPPRAVPEKLGFRLFRDRWQVPSVISALLTQVDMDDDEATRTFNMGIGMIVIVPEAQAQAAIDAVGGQAFWIGDIVERDGDREPVEMLG